MQAGSQAASVDGNVRFEATGDSDILLGLIDAGAGNVSLLAERDILDNNGGGVLNVQAAALRMEADSNGDSAGQIGQSDNGSPAETNTRAIDTQVTTLAAVSADGIYILESDGLAVDFTGDISIEQVNFNSTVTTVTDTTLSDLETTEAGPLKVVTTAGTLTVNTAVTAGTSGNVLLAARAGDGDVSPRFQQAESGIPQFEVFVLVFDENQKSQTRERLIVGHGSAPF